VNVTLTLHRGEAADAGAVGDIYYRAFKALAERHNFAPDLPSADLATNMLAGLISHEGFFDLVAEIDGRIVGSNFLDERNPISGVGPITVDPAIQNDGVGRALMQAVMRRSQQRGFAGMRLVQAGYHSRSLALYLKLGFDVREPLACLQGPAIGKAVPGHAVRAATANDLPDCNRLCSRVHGHDRNGELADAVAHGAARVVDRAGRVTGYATPVAFFGHAVGETNDDLKALIGAAPSVPGPGFLVPARNGELLRWCLAEGLRITQTMTLMTVGLYNQPDGAWLSSVSY
jgi:predicted N-acetyltransferase YhbS